MEYIRGRFSWVLRPFLIIYDLLVINILAYSLLNFNDSQLYFFSSETLNNKHLLYIFYSSFFWLSSTWVLKFYKVYRHTTALKIASLLIKQFLVYTLIAFAFMGVFRSINMEAFVVFKYLVYVFLGIAFMKLLSFYLLKLYRTYLKGNIRQVIIIGSGEGAKRLEKVFNKKKELGYNLMAIFSDTIGDRFSGTIKESFQFLEDNQTVDEIYCAINELTEKEVNAYFKYANTNHFNIKFISDTSEIQSKRIHTDYYDYLPIISFQEVALNNPLNKIAKRVFDILFSTIVIVFILSWLIPILSILIKLESRGPVFFKHKRNGLNYEEFTCYKFRSLRFDKEVDFSQVKQEDERLTRIGKFIRKTSIDELPQFYNVLFGDMSVVGPRPHMLLYTNEYAKIIDKYNFMFRHRVKQGITGLAQVSGFRGKIESDKDIINRIKYDIFYIENWSLLLDIKIIFKTLINLLKGDDKAY